MSLGNSLFGLAWDCGRVRARADCLRLKGASITSTGAIKKKKSKIRNKTKEKMRSHFPFSTPFQTRTKK